MIIFQYSARYAITPTPTEDLSEIRVCSNVTEHNTKRIHEYQLANAHILLAGGKDVAAPGVSDVIVENNVVENSDFGVEMDQGLLNVYMKGNRLPVSKNK